MNHPINILIHGYGKVGHCVQKYAHEDSNFNIVGAVSKCGSLSTHGSIEDVDLEDVDVIVDFSSRDAFVDLFHYISEKRPQIRIITGTSDWERERGEIEAVTLENKMYLLYGANFSIGTALFMRIVQQATALFDQFETFDVSLLDIHHRHKQDMPSSTAKKIAQSIVENSGTKNTILYGMRDEHLQSNELHVNCLRVGENNGFHEVSFDAADEVINISQQTRDRGAYALGALFSARWMMKQKDPGFYTFDECMDELTV